MSSLAHWFVIIHKYNTQMQFLSDIIISVLNGRFIYFSDHKTHTKYSQKKIIIKITACGFLINRKN